MTVYGRTTVAVGGVAIVFAVAAALRAAPREAREPFERGRADARPAEVTAVGSARLVITADAPADLVVDSVPPSAPAQLLWLDGRTAHPSREGALVLDGAGGVMVFDRRLTPRHVTLASEGREWTSVAPAPDGVLWLTDATGAVLRSDRTGRVATVGAAPFQYSTIATDPAMGVPWLARSAARFGYALDTSDTPLVMRAAVEDRDRPSASLPGASHRGAAPRPAHILLRDLASAGHLAVRGDTVYFAPFIQDELIAFGPLGDTLWVARRGLDHGTREPKFEVRNGSVTVDYSPVNLGLTVGPDGRLYLLSTPGRTTAAGRLDVFDPATGALLRSAALATAQPTLAADATGRVYGFDAAALLAGVPARQRPMVAAVDVPALGTGRVNLATYRGRVTLVNLWASWCAPCREEMPALDSLQRSLGTANPAFAFVSLDDDTDPAAATAFLREYRFAFRVGAGRGELKSRLHAPGLPVTLLLDREGREVRRWIGYTGPDQIAGIRAVAMAELRRAAPESASATSTAAGHRHTP